MTDDSKENLIKKNQKNEIHSCVNSEKRVINRFLAATDFEKKNSEQPIFDNLG